MPLTKKDITDLLDSKKIEYEIVEHQPVYTIDEMLECGLPHPEQIPEPRLLSVPAYRLFQVHRATHQPEPP